MTDVPAAVCIENDGKWAWDRRGSGPMRPLRYQAYEGLQLHGLQSRPLRTK